MKINPPEYVWEIQESNNATGEFIRMVQHEILSSALESMGPRTDSDSIWNISLVHRTNDNLLAASLIQGKLPEYFQDMTGITFERVPERFHKEFKEVFQTAE